MVGVLRAAPGPAPPPPSAVPLPRFAGEDLPRGGSGAQRHPFALPCCPTESIVRADLPMRLETSAGATTLEPNLVPLPNTRLFARIRPNSARLRGLRRGLAGCRRAEPRAAGAGGVGLRARRKPRGQLSCGLYRRRARATPRPRRASTARPSRPTRAIRRCWSGPSSRSSPTGPCRTPSGSPSGSWRRGQRQRACASRARRAKHLKAKQYATARAHLAEGRARPCRRPHRDAHRRPGPMPAQATARGRSRPSTSSRASAPTAVFRDYHAGLIAETVGNQAEAEKRLKAAYEAERNTLRIVDAYARLQARRGQQRGGAPDLRRVRGRAAAPPDRARRLEQLKRGKPLRPLVATAQEGAAEVLYGLGAAGNTQGRRAAGDRLPASRAVSQPRARRSPS